MDDDTAQLYLDKQVCIEGDRMSNEMNVKLFLTTLAKLWGEMEGVDVEVTFVKKQEGGE